MTTKQVTEQRDRFEHLLKNVDLKRIGKQWIQISDAGDGRYNCHIYIHRVLSICAKVRAAMYHPDSRGFYCEILTQAALQAYLKEVGAKV